MQLTPSPLLESTPVELLEAIIAQCDRSTLKRWCLVSKALLVVAAPQLYRHVALDREQDVIPFLERVRLVNTDAPAPPDKAPILVKLRHALLSIRQLDLNALPDPDHLIALSRAPKPLQPAAPKVKLTLNGAGQARAAMMAFFVPHLLSELRPIKCDLAMLFHDEDVYHMTIFSNQIELYLANVGRLPDRAYSGLSFETYRLDKLYSDVFSSTRAMLDLLGLKDEVAKAKADVVRLNLTHPWPAEARAVVASYYEYLPRPGRRCRGWDSVEEMQIWRRGLDDQVRLLHDQRTAFKWLAETERAREFIRKRNAARAIRRDLTEIDRHASAASIVDTPSPFIRRPQISSVATRTAPAASRRLGHFDSPDVTSTSPSVFRPHDPEAEAEAILEYYSKRSSTQIAAAFETPSNSHPTPFADLMISVLGALSTSTSRIRTAMPDVVPSPASSSFVRSLYTDNDRPTVSSKAATTIADQCSRALSSAVAGPSPRHSWLARVPAPPTAGSSSSSSRGTSSLVRRSGSDSN